MCCWVFYKPRIAKVAECLPTIWYFSYSLGHLIILAICLNQTDATLLGNFMQFSFSIWSNILLNRMPSNCDINSYTWVLFITVQHGALRSEWLESQTMNWGGWHEYTLASSSSLHNCIYINQSKYTSQAWLQTLFSC